MKTTTTIALGILAGFTLVWGCSDDETSNTTAATSASSTNAASSTTASTTSAGGETGSGGNGGMGGEGGSTMGASAACQACVADLYGNDQDCQAAVQACDADPGCDAWKNCNENCFNENDTVGCYDGCDQSFPHNETLSEALLECTCDACGNLCVAACT